MKIHKSLCHAVFAIFLGFAAMASATQPIQFNPNGTGAAGCPDPKKDCLVGTFDWAPGSGVGIGGNPPNGPVAGTKVTTYAQAILNALLDPNGKLLTLPTTTQFTFVMGYPQVVTFVSPPPFPVVSSTLDSSPPTGTPNFFEIWVSGVDADPLAGTGFNNGKRILFGQITSSLASYGQAQCTLFGSPEPTSQFDRFPSINDNDYPGVRTVCVSGGDQVSVNIITADTDYFPTFDPTSQATLIARFNNSIVTPFDQANPSRLFVPGDAGFDGSAPPPPSIAPKLGTVNGQVQGTMTLDFEHQDDDNQSFELGTVVPGACRVTYGGNAPNGNVDAKSQAESCSGKGGQTNCYTFGGQVGAPTANPAFGGPFGEHTHHQRSGPAGDFVFHAGTHSAPKTTRITATSCKDPGACRQAEANAGFKQIDFEGTGSFRTLDPTAQTFLAAKAGHPVLPDNQDSQIYYFRVDMDDLGEPGSKFDPKFTKECKSFLDADQNLPLSTPDPLLTSIVNSDARVACKACADVYQFYICKDANRCEQADAIYAVRGYLTGGNIQLHQVIK